MRIRRLVVTCTCTLLLSAIPLPAAAKVRTLWPIDFKVVAPTSQSLSEEEAEALQSFDRLSSKPDTFAYFALPVRLPVGARILKIGVNGKGSPGEYALVELLRARDFPSEPVLSAFVPAGSPRDWYYGDSFLPVEDASKVLRGHRYWVRCHLGSGAEIHRVKIFYRD